MNHSFNNNIKHFVNLYEVYSFANMVVNPFLCTETPCLYAMLTVHYFSKTAEQHLSFVVSIKHSVLKIGRNSTLGYLVLVKYKCMHSSDKDTSIEV